MQILEGVKFMERTCVSVIVPIYNTKPWLEECIRSILDQKFDQPFEVILVDDGATDGCGELCDQMAARDKRIRVIHQENQGLSAARNTGIDAAQGRYYAFVDSDDILRPTYLQTLYDACEKHDAYMSICAVEDVREDGSSAEPPAYTMPSETGVFSGKELLNRFYAPNGTYYTVAWNKLYRAEVWKLLHYPEGRLHEDDFVAHRLFWRCDKVVCLDAQLYCYRLRGGSICRTSIKPEAFDAVDGLADRYRFYVENGADRTVIDNAYAACWRRYLFLCAKVRQNPEPKLVKAISKEQFLMQGLISYLPNCKQLKMTEKLSAARWSMMPAESLCPSKSKGCPKPATNCRPPLRSKAGGIAEPRKGGPAVPLAKPDKKQEKCPRVLLLPPSALPIPAVRGGAVETLITHLIRENERQGKLDILCASVQDPDAKAAAADLQHTKMMYITRPRGHRRYWPMAFVERLFWRGRALRPLVPEGAAVAGAGTAPARLDHCRGRQPDPVRGHQPDVRPPALPGPPAWPDPVQPPDGRDLRRRAGPERVYPGRVPENQHPRPQKRPISCTTASTPGGSPPASRIWRCGPRWGFAPEDFVVLFCGRLEPDKGIHKLLEAIASLEDPRVKLLIVGSPFFGRTQTSPFLKKLEAAAPQPGRPGAVHRLSAKRVPAGLLPAGRPGLHAHAGAGGRRPGGHRGHGLRPPGAGYPQRRPARIPGRQPGGAGGPEPGRARPAGFCH